MLGTQLMGPGRAAVGEFVSVSAGNDHTCGLRTDGSVECWGSNEGGGGPVVVGQATPP